MTKKKETGLGGVDGIFQPMVDEPPQPEPITPAPPKSKSKPKPKKEKAGGEDRGTLRQTTFMLYDPELDWLDAKVSETRKNGGKPLRKAALVRAMIDLMIASPVDLKGVKSEADLIKRFEKAVKAK